MLDSEDIENTVMRRLGTCLGLLKTHCRREDLFGSFENSAEDSRSAFGPTEDTVLRRVEAYLYIYIYILINNQMLDT